jgi:hypothetical protein
MKAQNQQIVTIAIWVMPNIAVSTALQIHSSVRNASSQHTHIPLFITLKHGMAISSNLQNSLTLVSSSILDTLVFLAPHKWMTKFTTLSSVLCILSASHITASNPVAVNMHAHSTSNCFR